MKKLLLFPVILLFAAIMFVVILPVVLMIVTLSFTGAYIVEIMRLLK
jgi:hypothetical protein